MQQKNIPAKRRNNTSRITSWHSDDFLPTQIKKKTSSKDVLRVIPLGGMEEVGRNMMVFEYNDDIIIVDMGLQFPEDNMPGIDYVIPNTAYLKEKKANIRGIIITHGHYDHIGAIPHSMNRLGNPPIYTAPLTKGMILKRQHDFPYSPKLNIQGVKIDDKIKLGVFGVEFFHINHNIPDSMGVVINTPVGRVIHTGDFKFDPEPINEDPTDFERIKKLGNEGVALLMSDSTRAEKPGSSMSETEIHQNLSQIFSTIEGRIIIATFASLLTRVQSIIWLAEKFNRKVVIDGRSMKTNVEVAKELGYLKIKKGTIIKPNEANSLPNNKILILCTGAQGEDRAVLTRLATGEHKSLEMNKDDTVLFSSSVVAGNERSVQSLRDALCRKGARIINYSMSDIHSGGHAPAADLKKMIEMVKPKFFIPIEGNYYMHQLHGDIAKKAGVMEKNIVIPRNGDVVVMNKNSIKISEEKIPASYVVVDGLGVGDVGQVVLSDRQAMAENGMFVIIAVVDSKTGKVKGEPDIISRGFVYLRESQDLLSDARKKIKEIVDKAPQKKRSANWKEVKMDIRDKIGQMLYNKTQRKPMVLPVVIVV